MEVIRCIRNSAQSRIRTKKESEIRKKWFNAVLKGGEDSGAHGGAIGHKYIIRAVGA